MFRALTAIAVIALVAGCAGDTRRFYKDGVDLAQYERDAYECERDTRMSAVSFGGGVTAPTFARNFAIRCMQAKGYEWR